MPCRIHQTSRSELGRYLRVPVCLQVSFAIAQAAEEAAAPQKAANKRSRSAGDAAAAAISNACRGASSAPSVRVKTRAAVVRLC